MSRELRLVGLAHVGDTFTLRLNNGSTCLINPEPKLGPVGVPLYRFAAAIAREDRGLLVTHGNTLIVAQRLQFEIVAADEDALICEYRGQVS